MIILTLKQGDITKEPVDAIVNAANERMLGGGGVDGFIHKVAGPGLINECYQVPIVSGEGTDYEVRCPTGEARITGGHNLPARYVIHTVGPKCPRGIAEPEHKRLLKNCWINSLALADHYGLSTIAFPSIATGGYLFPIEEAAKIASDAIKEFEINNQNTSIKEIIIVTFTNEDYKVYDKVIRGEQFGLDYIT